MNPVKKMGCRVYQAAFRVAVKFLNWQEPKIVKGAGAIKQLPAIVKE